MAEPVSPQQVICEAAELIETRGWVQGREHQPGIGYCLKGACVAAANRHHLPPTERELLLELVMVYLAAVIVTTPALAKTATWTVVTTYNDFVGRTKAEALETARRAGRCST